MPDRALEDLRVVDISQGIAGPYATRLLADAGADVIKVEPPGGDYSRRLGPFPGDVPDPELIPADLDLGLHLVRGGPVPPGVAHLQAQGHQQQPPALLALEQGHQIEWLLVNAQLSGL